LIGVQRFGLSRGQRLSKRCLDIAGAAVGLAFMLPVFAVAAAAIKLSSRGPDVLPSGSDRARRPRLPHLEVPHDVL